MAISRIAAALGLTLLAYNIFGSSPGERVGIYLADNPNVDLLKNVVVEEEITEPVVKIMETISSPEPVIPSPIIAEEIEPEENKEKIKETYIHGGMSIKNETDYEIDTTEFLSLGPQVKLSDEGAQILIIHTHGSEAFTPAGLDRYEESDKLRTADTEYNIIRIGDELTKLLEEQGLKVIHDREIYDYPSYTGSYNRSGQAVENHLKENPTISVVFDIHRDALSSNGIIYKTIADESGSCASQIMLLAGSNASGLEHNNWQKNLSLALYLQQAVNKNYPSLMRPVTLVKERYNTHLTTGSMIVEVGSSGNTLQEALAAIRLFSNAIGPALVELIE